MKEVGKEGNEKSQLKAPERNDWWNKLSLGSKGLSKIDQKS